MIPSVELDAGRGDPHKTKTSYVPAGIRGDLLAVPLSFLTQRAGNGAHPGGIARRAPGRTWRPPSPGPLAASGGPSLPAGAGRYFSVHCAYKTVYYHFRALVSSIYRAGPFSRPVPFFAAAAAKTVYFPAQKDYNARGRAVPFWRGCACCSRRTERKLANAGNRLL